MALNCQVWLAEMPIKVYHWLATQAFPVHICKMDSLTFFLRGRRATGRDLMNAVSLSPTLSFLCSWGMRKWYSKSSWKNVHDEKPLHKCLAFLYWNLSLNPIFPWTFSSADYFIVTLEAWHWQNPSQAWSCDLGELARLPSLSGLSHPEQVTTYVRLECMQMVQISGLSTQHPALSFGGPAQARTGLLQEVCMQDSEKGHIAI